MRWKLLGAAAVLVLAAAGAAGFLWMVARGPSFPEGELVLPGLDGPVEILRDSLGVPHVWASTVDDAFFAQGYLHAFDRLWQMELLRRVAGGRLSELFGERTLDSDRFLRTLGLHRAAESSLSVVDGEARRSLESYARGVNAALEGWDGPLPPELMILRAPRPDPWQITHTLAVEKVMAWDLAEYERSLALAGARSRLGEDLFAEILPDYPDWGATILGVQKESGVAEYTVPGPAVGPAPAGTLEPSGRGALNAVDRDRSTEFWLPPPSSPALVASAQVPEFAARVLEAGSWVRASNAWVVSGRRSHSGKPLLANDMHLSMNAPALWYLIALHAPGLDVAGMSLPGVPGVVAGHSAAVAWGFTNAMVDDSDFFVERLDPEDSTRYMTPAGSEPFRTRVERIRVRGQSGVAEHRIRESRHGPIITPVEARAGGELLAFRWVAHDPSTTSSALLRMNRASDAASFIQALRGFTNPHQNVVFADTAGNFGYWMAGRVPLRRSGAPPLLPVPGWTGSHDWVGALPFQEHPHSVNPSTDFVVTANNRQTPDSVAALITSGGWERPYRAMRIQALLADRDEHDAASLLRIQMDVGSAFVERYRNAAAAAFGAAGLPEAESLEAWDGRATLESRSAVLFFGWVQKVRSGLQSRLYGEARGYYPLYAAERVLDRDDQVMDVLGPSAARSAVEWRAMRWAEAHRLELQHPLASVPILGALMGFGKRSLPSEGSHHSVNVAGFTGTEPPFIVRWGPSQRHVVDLADPDGPGGFILPGGQSGYPRNRHAWDQLERWRVGGLWRLPLHRPALEPRVVSRVRLVPLPSSGR